MAEHDTTVRRAYQIYLYAVCFVGILVVLFASSQAIYGIVRIAAPGTTAAGDAFGSGILSESAERDRGIASLIQNGVLALVAYLVFAFHWSRAGIVRAELERGEGAPETELPEA